MEFYEQLTKRLHERTQVSIPNGMEFYKINKKFTTKKLLFQFPTGWNSTAAFINGTRSTPVSIPNGMEFYRIQHLHPLKPKRFQFPTGWNSTLPGHRVYRPGNVSIPNGMEFY